MYEIDPLAVLVVGSLVTIASVSVWGLANLDVQTFIVNEKGDNTITLVHNRKYYQRVMSFSDAYRDMVTYNNIRVGDKLRVHADYLKSDVTPNASSNRFIIKRINGKKTKKIVKKAFKPGVHPAVSQQYRQRNYGR